MNKKLLITIGVVLVIVGGFAFVVMRRARLEKQFGRSASFREFLGLGDKNTAPGTQNNNILSTLFNTPTSDGGPKNDGFNPLVSLFTTASSTVDMGAPAGTNINNPWLNQQTSTNPTGVPTPPLCSDVDLNIAFTPEERRKLDLLRVEFDALSRSLYDDDNISEELTTYNGVAAELLSTRDLRQYCENLAYPKGTATTVPGFSGTNISRRVPTPFWNDINYDNRGFLSNRSPQTNDIGVETVNPQGTYADYDSIEKNFRLNIW